MKSGIYKLQNVVNGKFYIGSSKNLEYRKKTHLSFLDCNRHENDRLQKSYRKHGKSSFIFKTLLICKQEDLLFYEQLLIDNLNPVYNICRIAGSSLGIKWSEEAKARVRGRKRTKEAVELTAAAHRGMKRSDETKRKIAEKALGSKKPPRSEEYRRKVSERCKGQVISKEHFEKLQNGRKNRKFTEEQKINISLKLKECYENGSRSRIKTKEHCNKISKFYSKLTAAQVLEIKARSLAGETGRSLALAFNSPTSTISNILNGKSYKWVEEELGNEN